MKLSISLTNRIFNFLFRRVALARVPDFVVGTYAAPYLHRWWLAGRKPNPRKPGHFLSRSVLGLFSPYLHCFMRSDDDRALHDHPAASISLVLCGACIEHTIAAGGVHQRRLLMTGDIRIRSATMAHRIEVPPGGFCWTLFIFGPKYRQWFFHCEKGLVHWEQFTAHDNPGEVGRGCGE